MTWSESLEPPDFRRAEPPGPDELIRLVEAAAVGLWTYDAGERITFVNGPAAEALGRPADELLGRRLSELRFAEDLPALEQRLARRRAGEVERYEKRIRRPDGSARWIAVAAVPAFDGAGNFTGASGLLLDVTERRRAEEWLRLQAAALECTANAIVVTDVGGKVESANPAFASLTGFALDELKGRSLNVLRSGAHPSSFYGDLWATVLAGGVWRGQLVNRRADGSLYDEEMTISPVAGADGRPSHFIAVKQDVTARNRAALQLREQAEILAMAHDAIIVQDLHGRIRIWNQGASRILGWTEEEAVGRPLDELLGPPGLDRLPSTRDHLREHGELTQDLRVSSRSGEQLDLATRWSAIHDPEGRPSGVLCVAYDVTETRRLQGEAAKNQRLESLGHLAGGIAHDLNNILVPIFSAAEDLGREPLSGAGREALQDLEASARSAGELVRQVLAFARGAGARRAPVPLQALLDAALRLLRRSLPDEVKLVSRWPDDLWPIEGDRAQLHQVLLNLCLNARDAMPRGGSLQVTAANLDLDRASAARLQGLEAGRYVELRVTDDGAGIPANDLGRIFEPFFTTKANGHGTGLGLSTVQRVVRTHGGRVLVASEVGLGTEFRVLLPALDGSAAGQALPAPRPSWSGRTALVADDEPLVRGTIVRTLEDHGLRVIAARDGLEAVTLFGEPGAKVDFLVTNLWMANLDGRSTIQLLRRLRPDLRVLLVTGELLDDRLPPLGPGELLRKPFTPAELVSAVLRVLPPAAKRQTWTPHRANSPEPRGSMPGLEPPSLPCRVVFVDDEPALLHGLQHVLHALRRRWDMRFARGGEEALALLEAGPADVVVTDVRMPGMSGLDLLREVRRRWPQTARLVLSGRIDLAVVAQASAVAHRYLLKPCAPEQLRGAIERAVGLQAALASEPLRRVTGALASLPAGPSVYQALSLALIDPAVEVDRLVEIVSANVAMSERVLHFVNSAYYGLARKVSSIGEAIVLLGTETLRHLALTLEVFAAFPGAAGSQAAFEEQERHALLTARIARRLARTPPLGSPALAETAFAAGLLHDCGKLVLLDRLPHEQA